MPHINRVLTFLGYAYLLRVPLLTWLALVALWIGSFPDSGAEPILRGIFDVGSPDSSVLATCAEFVAVTVAALLAGTCIGVSSRLVVCNGHSRFRSVPVQLSRGLELSFRLVPLSAFLAVVITALLRSGAPWAGKLPGVVIGVVFWYLLTVTAARFFSGLFSGKILWLRSGAWIPEHEPGYLSLDTGTLQVRHLFATYQFLLALTLYLLYCLVSGFGFAFLDGGYLIPTLSLILLLSALISWGLSGVAFFLDRYRIPLLIPLVAMSTFSGFFKQADYFYEGKPLPKDAPPIPTAAAIIEAHTKSADANMPMVLVATTGGGIQAAAWTAQVLTGLNQQVAITRPGVNSNFSHYVRLISSVSGGSVGAMYFAASYQNGEVKPEDGPEIVQSAEASSLDEVTWGLAYPDLVFGLFPWLKGIGVLNGGIHMDDRGAIFTDRGRMLEASWRPRLARAERDATLSDWRGDTASGARPAIIFNSTLVETGERYLLATTSFNPDRNDTAKEDGRREFFSLYPNSDLRVRTAARLSATFPYVTPAARMLRNDENKAPDGRFYLPEPHAVDGGYYDNYGMVSLLDWLDNGLQAVPDRPKVLIVEIRASPTEKQTHSHPQSSTFGAIFQLTHPLLTLAKVRGTGQLSHNALDQSLLNRIYSPNICEVTFEFSSTDARGCRRTEPLNWHLTNDDMNAVRTTWENSPGVQAGIEQVKNFLKEGGTCQLP